MVKVKVTENTGVTDLKISKNTKFTVMPTYQMGRLPSNHKSKKTAESRIRKLINDKIDFIIFDSHLNIVTLKDFLYD